MDESSETELRRRLRANRRRRLLPDFSTRFERAFGYRPDEADWLELEEADRVREEAYTPSQAGALPSRTWPDSQHHELFAHLRALGDRVGEEHSSYLIGDGFVRRMTRRRDEEAYWHEVGAVRVSSRVVLTNLDDFWEEGLEDLGLLTLDLRDGLLVSYSPPLQAAGADEYELHAWGAFAPHE